MTADPSHAPLSAEHKNKMTPDDKLWSIISHLEGEARNYIINKAKSERDTPEKVFELLVHRFGTGGIRMQVRQAFATRQQSYKERKTGRSI